MYSHIYMYNIYKLWLKIFFLSNKKWEFQTLAKMFSREAHFINFKKKDVVFIYFFFVGIICLLLQKTQEQLFPWKTKKKLPRKTEFSCFKFLNEWAQ